MDGKNTRSCLRYWDKDSGEVETLAGALLKSDGYINIDPSHPLGGPDGKRDLIIQNEKSQEYFIVGCYFAREPKDFSDTKSKFVNDYSGVASYNDRFKAGFAGFNEIKGFVFFTNQHLTLHQRETLISLCDPKKRIEIYHLERITVLLNQPINVTHRFDYLGIPVSPAAHVSFLADMQKKLIDKIDQQDKEMLKIKNELSQFKRENKFRS